MFNKNVLANELVSILTVTLLQISVLSNGYGKLKEGFEGIYFANQCLSWVEKSKICLFKAY